MLVAVFIVSSFPLSLVRLSGESADEGLVARESFVAFSSVFDRMPSCFVEPLVTRVNGLRTLCIELSASLCGVWSADGIG